MAQIITTITNKQKRSPQIKNKYILLGKDEKPVASLIDRDLAEKWVSQNKFGAVKYIEAVLGAGV